MAGYYLVPDARLDLISIVDYIMDESTTSALRVQERFLEIFSLIGENPNVGHLREDLTSRPVRFFPVFSYLVIYLPDTNPVQIVRVLGAAQDVKNILN
jgi:plasmid stabilization system protein ParE